METKQDYQNQMRTQLSQLDARIDEIKATSGRPNSNTRIQYREQLALSAKRDAACQKLLELQESRDEAWQDLKAGVDGAWYELQSSVNDASSKFQ